MNPAGATFEPIEEISAGGQLIAYIVKSQLDPEATRFLTGPELSFQAGLVVVPGGQEITRHDHKQLTRTVNVTAEAIFVRKGRCEVDIYDAGRNLVATRELRAGDMTLFLGVGGHGFRAIETVVLFEIKQGPYLGLDDKERF